MPHFEHNSDTFGYINLEALDGVQKALQKLGHDPGAADGKDGPNTQRAVRAFQASVTIKIDGIVGPETRAALMTTLAERAAAGAPSANG
ncbi:MAG TPA: peptidoglycan-binding domain-containing protein [Polyangiaceae bacterium]|nr:peptidoglycan-binding domain-containing protein [Polyangiaceae bacterium]